MSEAVTLLLMTRTYPGGWVKDVDNAEDEKALLRRLKGDWRREVENYGFSVFAVHPDTYVNEMGDLTFKIGHPPKLLNVFDGKKNKGSAAKAMKEHHEQEKAYEKLEQADV